MVTKKTRPGAKVERIRQRSGYKGPLYLIEHMEAKGVSDEQLAGRLDVDRVTVTRYCNGTRRPNPERIAQIEDALGIGDGDLFKPPQPKRAPDRPSLDEATKEWPTEAVNKLAELLPFFAKTGTGK